MDDLNFVTAARDAETEADEPTPITLDGRRILVYRPSSSSLALLFAEMADVDTEDPDTVTPNHLGAIVDFFLALLDGKDASHIRKRLRSRRDDFDVDSIYKIFTRLTKEWSGHPTQESQDSTSQPEPSGPTSSSDSAISI